MLNVKHMSNPLQLDFKLSTFSSILLEALLESVFGNQLSQMNYFLIIKRSVRQRKKCYNWIEIGRERYCQGRKHYLLSLLHFLCHTSVTPSDSFYSCFYLILFFLWIITSPGFLFVLLYIFPHIYTFLAYCSALLFQRTRWEKSNELLHCAKPSVPKLCDMNFVCWVPQAS